MSNIDGSGKDSIPSWVNAKDPSLQSKAPDSAQRTSKNNNLVLGWKKKFPLIVCAREWDCEKSSLTLLPKRRKARIRFELRRNPSIGLGIHGYRDLESGPDAKESWENIIEHGDIVLVRLNELT